MFISRAVIMTRIVIHFPGPLRSFSTAVSEILSYRQTDTHHITFYIKLDLLFLWYLLDYMSIFGPYHKYFILFARSREIIDGSSDEKPFYPNFRATFHLLNYSLLFHIATCYYSKWYIQTIILKLTNNKLTGV